MGRINLHIDEKIAAIKRNNDVKNVMLIIHEIFSPVEFQLRFAKSVKGINPLKKYKVELIEDIRFENHEILRINAKHIIDAFEYFLNKIIVENKYSIEELFHHLKFLSNYFNMEAETFNLRNLFTFSSSDTFFTKIENEKIIMNYNQFILNKSHKELIKDYYELRYCLYKELALVVNRILLRVELENYRVPEIQITENGITAITEFIMAIENNPKYVKTNANNPKILQDRFSKAFGVSGTKFSKKRDNLENNKKLGSHLIALARNMKIKPIKK